MRIPFTLDAWLKNNSQKVETRDGRPVKIISFEMTDTNDCPIAAQFRLCAGTPVVYLFDKEGHYKGEGDSDYDLFIVTTEQEMSEFEKRLQEVLFEHATTNSSAEEKAHQYSSELLDIAKQQLLQSGELMTQEHHEKLMEILNNAHEEELEKAYKNADEVQYRKGREDALKDLPRWRKCEKPFDSPSNCGYNGVNLINHGYALSIDDAYTKLPKDE